MAAAAATRLASLDLLRGLAVAGMILVTSPGDWNRAYAPLRHADWHGWTPTDLIFPAFLFSVGVALGLSFPRDLSGPEQRRLFWTRLARRVLALIALGLILNLLSEAQRSIWAHTDILEHFRIPGVLQRIALCYAFGAVLILATARRDAAGRSQVNGRALGVAIAAILLFYWALLTFVPVPGYGTGHLDPEGNLPAFVDRAVFTVPHLWWLGSAEWQGPVVYDPEGLLSTFPAAVDTLFGVLAAVALRRAPEHALRVLIAAGLALVAAGFLLDPLFPINKRIWTSSFALLSSGFAALAFAALTLAARSGAVVRLLTPLRILGGNAILAFTLSILLSLFSGLPILHQGGAVVTPQQWGNSLALRFISDPYLASLACALAIVTLITLIIWPLHRRAIHWRL